MKNEVIRLRISEKEKQAVQEEAERQQMSMSEWLLCLIREELKKQLTC